MTDPAPLRVLVVEDEALLALDIEGVVEDEGHTVVGEAACARSAEALPDSVDPSLALVDLQLAHGTSGLEVCEMIRRRWPSALVVFVTANPQGVPDDLAGAYGILTKPFSHQGLSDVLRYLDEGIHDPPPNTPPPPVLKTSPTLRTLWSH